MKCLLSSFCMCVLAGAMGAAAAPPSITGIGFLEPLDDSPATRYSTASGVSDDGSVVVGEQSWWGRSTYGLRRAVRWTRGGGLQNLGLLAGYTDSTANGVSADGRVVIGTSTLMQGPMPVRWRAFRWTVETGMRGLSSFPEVADFAGSQAAATDADGSIVVGANFGWPLGDNAFRWGEATGVVSLQCLPDDYASQAWAVSGDGSIIVGESYGKNGVSAFRWTIENGMEDIGTLGGDYTWAWAVSRDGHVIVGSSGTPPISIRGFRWTRETGVIDLGMLPGAVRAYPLAASADGSVIVGRCSDDTLRAFLWTAATGMVDLKEHLVSLGVDMSEWALESATGISGDGRYIVGAGIRNGEGEGWIADLGLCEVDLDGDGFVTGADVDLYVAAFEAGGRERGL